MATIVITRLADLRVGDVILSLDGRRYRTPLRVTDPLGPITAGSPVRGVRVQSPNPASGIEGVLPLTDGRTPMGVERPDPCSTIDANSTIRVHAPNRGGTMSYIVRTGNLAAAPELRQGERGPYTYARVIVSDRIRQEDGSYTDGPAIAYDVAVSGAQATALVETAQRSGNVRVTFAGRYRVTEYRGEQGARVQHEVRADEVAVSLRGQSVTVERGGRGDEPGEESAF